MNNDRQNPERSVVSILVADMVGSTTRIANLDPDEAAELFDRVYTHFSAAVEAEGGGFVSFAGDGGVAVFGWPESQEDHADRACLAAWAIQEKMMRPGGLNANDVENVHFRVGVHSGLVGLRQISLHFGRMLDTVGGTVHLAATLEKKAKPGEIQISTATADLCRCELDIEAGPGVPALEKTGATALRLRARPAPPPGLTRVAERPVVGRSEEREVLADAVRAARTSFKSIGMIGEPGIGKSHLAISAIDAAKTEVPEIKLAVFNGDARMRSTPFAAARSIIADLAEPLGLGEKAEASDLLNALNIASEFPGAAETVFGQSAEALDPRPTSTEVGRTFAAMIAALSAQAPLLLIVEDLHLLDPESAVCLEILSKAPEETHGFLLLTSRPEGRATLDRVAQEIREIIAMAPSDLRALAKAVSEDVNSDPHHLELAIERSGGVPFILEQLLLSDDVKALERRDAMPQTVQSLIHARLNRLSNETKQTAQVLSILGERVDIALAQQMLSLSTTEMMAQMAELDSLSLIRPAPGSEIRFAHAIVADACSVTVPRSWRQDIHYRAVSSIMSVYADPNPHLERLAWHSEEAQQYAQALEYLWSAAKNARRNGADESLYLICRSALRCAENLPQAEADRYGDIVLLSSPSMLQLGFFDGMDRQLARTMDIARAQGRHDKICGAQCHLGMLRWFAGAYSEGRDVTAAALETAEVIGAMPLIFSAKIIHTFCLHAMGQLDEAIRIQRELCETLTGELELSRLGTSWIPSSITHSFLAWSLCETGDYKKALSHAERGHSIAVRAGDVYSQIMGLHAIGRASLLLSENQAATDALTMATELITQHGYETVRPHVTGHLAMALSRIGKSSDAVAKAMPLTDEHTASTTGSQEMILLYNGLAEALFETGAQDESLAWVKRAIDMAEDSQHRCLQVQTYGMRAKLLRRKGADESSVAVDLKRMADISEEFGIEAPPLI